MDGFYTPLSLCHKINHLTPLPGHVQKIEFYVLPKDGSIEEPSSGAVQWPQIKQWHRVLYIILLLFQKH